MVLKKTHNIIAMSLVLSTSLFANSVALEDVTVTASKQGDKKIEEIAGAISVIDEFKLSDQNIDDSTKLQNITPNLYITKTGPSSMTSFATMRGITGGMNSIPSVGFYVDDIYYSSLDIPLYDIQRVEVLKGPQGTLYGRNSEAGIINIVTKDASSEDSGKMSLNYSSNNTQKASLVFNKALDETTFLRGALRYTKTDGYFTNKFNDSNKVGREENTDFRISLKKEVSDNLNFVLSLDKQEIDSPNYAQFAPYDSKDLRKNVNVNELGQAYKKAYGVNLKTEYEMDKVKLLSITSFRNDKFKSANDVDFTQFDLSALDLNKDLDSISEELRLVSTSKSSFDYIAGLFLLSEKDKRNYNTSLNFANMGFGIPAETLTQNTRNKTFGTGVFGEISKKFFDTKLTLGLRYDREKKKFDYKQTGVGAGLTMFGYNNSNGKESKTYDAWLPKISLSYEKYDSFTPYAVFSKGFKSGGFNDNANLGSSYRPEFTTNYEIGFKSKILDNLKLNMALFKIDWKDMQVESETSTSIYIDNASNATSKGVELEMDYLASENLSFSLGLAYTSAKYDDYKRGSNDYSGKRVIDVPKTTINLATTYRMDNGFYAGANYSRFGDIYFDNENNRTQSYDITNVKIGYEQENFDIYVYGNNIFDEEYKTRAFALSSGDWYARSGAPSQFGIALNYRF